jgi:hypothetical protein
MIGSLADAEHRTPVPMTMMIMVPPVITITAGENSLKCGLFAFLAR